MDADILRLKGVGPKSLVELNKMGVYTVKDIIHFYPRTYENWLNPKTIEEVYRSGMPGCIRIKKFSVTKVSQWNYPKMFAKLIGSDGESDIDILIFNNFHMIQKFIKGENALIFGSVEKNLLGYKIVGPKISQKQVINPIYHQTKILSSKRIEGFVKLALELSQGNLEETLPESIRKKYSLCTLEFAIKNIHFPSSMQDIEIAKRRLIFEEIFIWQISMALIKNYVKHETDIKILNDYLDEFLFLLPFIPTNAQLRAIKECTKDMIYGNKLAMSRLLQGDVGSGKTVVAAALAYNIVRNGYQVAVMVPTELLSVQHYNTFSKILDGVQINIGLLSGKIKSSERKVLEDEIKTGKIDIIIGTHALISERLEFANLGLVITDEQHRFGVKQRTKLVEKGKNPHMMIMSATPIPRTLSMIMYGDLDISILDELPPGREIVKTFCVHSNKRERAFNFLKKIVDSGGQGYIICPCIEASEGNIASVNDYKAKILNKDFIGYNAEVLHGQMSTQERDNIMQKFIEGDLQILVSTTVIEVGVDVPNASIIIIENAERFGLSQLHQLRGRVGRGEKKSYCILISDTQSEETIRRFKAMCSTNDGFYLANEDLNIRGPGEIFGDKQHGLTELKLAKTLRDMDIVKDSKDAVREILSNGYDIPGDELKCIRNKVKKVVNSMEKRIVM